MPLVRDILLGSSSPARKPLSPKLAFSDAIWKRRDLDVYAKVVLAYLCRRAGAKTMRCWPSRKTTMRSTSIGSNRTLNRSLRVVREKNILSWTRKLTQSGGWINEYQLHHPDDWAPVGERPVSRRGFAGR